MTIREDLNDISRSHSTDIEWRLRNHERHLPVKDSIKCLIKASESYIEKLSNLLLRSEKEEANGCD